MSGEIVIPANVAPAFIAFNTAFRQGQMSIKPLWQTVAMRVPSVASKNVYPWLNTFPIFREWLGARVENALDVASYELKNRDWEETVPIKIDQFEDDQIGLFGSTFEMMGQASTLFPDQQIWKMIEANPVGYDGLAFFHDAHPVNVNDAAFGTFDNNFALALDQTNFDTVRAAFRRFKAPNGDPLGIAPDTLWYPPELRGAALTVTQSAMIAAAATGGAVSNYNLNVVEPVEVPWLTDTNCWYLGVGKLAIKPALYQVRSERGVYADMSKVFDHKTIRYGADKRAAFGVTFPFLMAKSNPS